MPELPEVETVVRELNKKLKNRVMALVQVNAPKMVAVGFGVVSNIRQANKNQVTKFVTLIEGQKILSVKRRAKLIIFNLSRPFGSPSPSLGEGKIEKTSFSLLVHLKMTGQFIFEDQKQFLKTAGKYRLLNKFSAPLVQLPSKHTHVVFKFKDKSTLYYNDVRKFGYLKLVAKKDLQNVKEFKEYGPEPLEKVFTFEKFENQIAKRKTGKVKQVLMDNKVVVGIGNIYSDEILFHAKVRPMRNVASLSEIEKKYIFKYILQVLKKAIEAKGSSVGDFIRTDGSWGSMGKFHFVYGRRGQKCLKCGTIIQSIKLGGRTGSFCPKCQK